METKTVTWTFKKPDEWRMSGNPTILEAENLKAAFIRNYRKEIMDWLEPEFNAGWRPRFPIDGGILIVEYKTKTNFFTVALELINAANTRHATNTHAIGSFLIFKGYSVELVRD